MEVPAESSRKALPLAFNVLNQVSEAELNAVPPFRARAVFNSWLKSHGGSPGMVWLTKENAKTAKNKTSPNPLARMALQATFNLKPARSSGVMDVCGACSSPGCRLNCLSDTGRFSSMAAQNVQQKHTEFMREDPLHALALLRDEFAEHVEDAYAQGLHPVGRFNTLSDIPFHLLKTAPSIIGRYDRKPLGVDRPAELRHLPGATFSEYSGENMRGALGRPEPKLPFGNLSIAHSVKEWTTNARIKELAEQGRNLQYPVAMEKGQEVPSHVTRPGVGGEEPITLRAYSADRDDSRWADPEQGYFGVLKEKLAGKMQGKNTVINPHSNEHGFIGTLIAGNEGMVSETVRQRYAQMSEKAIARGTAERITSRPTPVQVRSSRTQAFRGE